MALMQRPAFSQLVIPETRSSSKQRCGGCGNSGLTLFCATVRSDGPFSTSSMRNWRRRTLSCRSSGGTRRDDAKNVAKNQKRRARHVKGITPTKPELLDELQAEEEADEELDRFEASGGSGNDDLDEFIDKIEEGTEAKDDSELNKDASDTSGSASGVEEVVDAGDNTYVVKFFPDGKGGGKNAQDRASDVASTAQEAPESTGDRLSATGDNVQETVTDATEDVSNIAQDTAGDVTSTVQEAAESTGKRLSEAGDDVQDSVGGSASDVSNIAQDTAADVTSIAQEATESTGRSLSEAGDDIQASVGDTAEDVTDTVQEAAESTGENLGAALDDVQEIAEEGSDAVAEVSDIVQDTSKEVGDIVQDTTQEVISTADETAREVGKSLEEAGGAVLESLEEVTSEGQKTLEEGGTYARGQMEESRRELEVRASDLSREADRAGERLAKAGEKVTDEAEKSLQNVQESLSTLMDDSVKAAGTIGNEALRLGEVMLTAAGEAAGFRGNEEQTSVSNGSVSLEERPKTEANEIDGGTKPVKTRGNREIQGKKYKSGQPKEDKEEEKNQYKGLKVTVAGASGRTGKLVVEELVRKGVPVRAVVRDKNSAEAKDLRKLFNVEVVQADLYKYESVKQALGDSNVVISAVGARSFAFDPIGTYQGEFEGVKNLVAAAKNKGDVKKFVFVTSLGVTFLQIIPLLFWKKQSELYLQRSGLDYTVVRPGGLTNARRNAREGLVMKPADTQFGGSISRQKVAEVCLAALITPEASEKIVEIVSGGEAGRSYSDLFGSV